MNKDILKISIIGVVLFFVKFVLTELSVSVIPGWNTTMLPPFFMFFEILISVLIFAQWYILAVYYLFQRQNPTLLKAITYINTVFLIIGISIALNLIWHLAVTIWSGYLYEMIAFYYRANVFGLWIYNIQWFLNAALPLLFFSKKLRQSPFFTFIFLLLAVLNVYVERIVLYLTTLYGSYDPASWSYYEPLYFYQIGLFFLFLLLITAIYFKTKKS